MSHEFITCGLELILTAAKPTSCKHYVEAGHDHNGGSQSLNAVGHIPTNVATL